MYRPLSETLLNAARIHFNGLDQIALQKEPSIVARVRNLGSTWRDYLERIWFVLDSTVYPWLLSISRNPLVNSIIISFEHNGIISLKIEKYWVASFSFSSREQKAAISFDMRWVPIMLPGRSLSEEQRCETVAFVLGSARQAFDMFDSETYSFCPPAFRESWDGMTFWNEREGY